MKFNPFKSKTFWGAVLSAAAYCLQHGFDIATVGQAVGAVLAVVGARDAIEPAPKS